jgi:molybdenum cofactor synthesis domain-containing protein
MAKPLSIDEARARLLGAADFVLEPENVALLDAVGRRVATDVVTDVPWPTTDRAAMDGFAVAAGAFGLPAGTRLRVAGESLAGRPFPGAAAEGSAIRIMTGAVVPAGCDAVVPVEATSGFAGSEVELQAPAARGDHVRPVGSEARAGEVVIHAGSRLRAAEIGVLATLGIDPAPVHRRPRVAILATGDEVVPISRVPAPHEVRDSNSHALAAQLLECGAEPRRAGTARDDAAALRRAIAAALDEADLLLTIGGVSKGTHDLVTATLAELGVAELFHGLDLKPGKPAFAGARQRDGRTRFVVGLPGNPASAVTVFDLLVRPLLAHLTGAPPPGPRWKLPLAGEPYRRNARTQAIPARLRRDASGAPVAELGRVRPSGDPFGLVPADGYVLIPADTPAGALAVAEFEPYSAGCGW